MKKVFEETKGNIIWNQFFYETTEERKEHIMTMEGNGFRVDEKYYEVDKNNNTIYVCYFSKEIS